MSAGHSPAGLARYTASRKDLHRCDQAPDMHLSGAHSGWHPQYPCHGSTHPTRTHPTSCPAQVRHMIKQSAEENGTSPEAQQCNMDALNAMVSWSC